MNEQRRRLVTENKIHIPDGIKYDKFPTRLWPQLKLLEAALAPYRFVDCSYWQTPTWGRFSENSGRRNIGRVLVNIGGVLVDSRTFQNPIGVQFTIPEELEEAAVWAQRCRQEIDDYIRRTNGTGKTITSAGGRQSLQEHADTAGGILPEE